MGGVASKHNATTQTVVPSGKIRICVAGFRISHWTGRAHRIASYIAKAYPDKFETWYYWDKDAMYNRFAIDTFDKVPFPLNVKGHDSAPFIWLEVNKAEASGPSAEEVNTLDGNAILEVLGGCSEFQSWIKQHTAKADGTPFVSPREPLTPEEIAAKVARGPSDVLYFKEDPELSKIWTGMSLFDAFHPSKYGPQTAASNPSDKKLASAGCCS